jgi:DNA-binding XRE family transcriptional regulator
MTIRTYRIKRGWTQEKAAEFFGVSQPTIHSWETRKFRPPLKRRRKIEKQTNGKIHAVRGWR